MLRLRQPMDADTPSRFHAFISVFFAIARRRLSLHFRFQLDYRLIFTIAISRLIADISFSFSFIFSARDCFRHCRFFRLVFMLFDASRRCLRLSATFFCRHFAAGHFRRLRLLPTLFSFRHFGCYAAD